MSYDLDRRYFTVVLEMPNGDNERKDIANAFKIGSEFKGATVTSASIGDAITELERYEN